MTTLLQQFLSDYINGDDSRNAMQAKLLKEMQDWADKQDGVFLANKALRMYNKAFFVKKIALAQRIKNKYGHLFPRHDDLMMAMSLAMAPRKTL